MDDDILLAIFANFNLWVFLFDICIISFVVTESLLVMGAVILGLTPPLIFHTIYTIYTVWKTREVLIL